MDDIEKFKALLNSTSHQMGTEFSKTCIKLLDEIIISVQKKELDRINLEKQSKEAEIIIDIEETK